MDFVQKEVLQPNFPSGQVNAVPATPPNVFGWKLKNLRKLKSLQWKFFLLDFFVGHVNTIFDKFAHNLWEKIECFSLNVRKKKL